MARMTRREFVAMSAKGVALASVPIVFRANPLAAFAVPESGSQKLSSYYDHFGVNDALIREVMAAGLEHGGDYCDLFFQHTISNSVGLEDNAVNRAYSNVDFGVGIRVCKGEQTGYSFTEEITPRAMKLAARTASNIASQAGTAPPVGLKFHETPNYYPIETSWEDVRIDRKIPQLQRINDKVLALDNRAIRCRVYLSDDSSYMLLATSEGRVVCDFQPMARIYTECTAEQDGRREQSFSNLCRRKGIELFTPDKLDRLAGEVVRRTVALFDAVKPDAGEMPIVLAAGSSGVLLHEAIGHGMEADYNRKEISIYSDKIDKPVAEKFVSIVDDGTNLNLRGSINVDDEGNDTEKTYLVENGVLRSYLHDRISAKHYKVKPTGNGRRQSFRYPPIPRMRNTYMLPGPHTKEEIIGSVKKGLYTEVFSNGQVHIGAGDFSFYVQCGYLIENGKLTKPVKDINLIGNGPDVLEKVVMVADDLKLSEGGWSCGKYGQKVPVSLGLPTVKASAITVGGVS